MEESELRVAAGVYVAGELSSDDVAAFEALLQREPQLEEEVSFWRRCRSDLSANGRPEAQAPGPDFAQAIRHRLDEGSRQVFRPRFDAWRWTGWAAAAACLAVLIGQWGPREAVFYDEGGNAVVPISSKGLVHDVAYRPQQEQEQPKPEVSAWLGLSGLRPTPLPEDLSKLAKKDRGLVVFQVEGPAAEAGIRPGDIILNVAECPTFSRVCVRHAMAQQKTVGTSVPVRYWSLRDEAIKVVMIDPGEIWR